MIKQNWTLEESKKRITTFLNNATCAQVFLTTSEYDLLDAASDMLEMHVNLRTELPHATDCAASTLIRKSPHKFTKGKCHCYLVDIDKLIAKAKGAK